MPLLGFLLVFVLTSSLSIQDSVPFNTTPSKNSSILYTEFEEIYESSENFTLTYGSGSDDLGSGSSDQQAIRP